jgi:uncharacterized protein (TIGR00645 family)
MSASGSHGIDRPMPPLAQLIFLSRWLQAPLYFGLIVAQGVYVYRFFLELWHLIVHARTFEETQVMLVVLGLIDVVMIANLLIMVIIGGYETFVSRLYLEGHPDQPEWLSHVNAGVLKVKLATALIGISSIHLLKTFINLAAGPGPAAAVAAAGGHGAPQVPSDSAVGLQIVIHLTFVISAYALAATDRLASSPMPAGEAHHKPKPA